MIISENAVVIVQRANKVVYHDGDRIIKVFNDVKPASDVFNESLNTARVAETGIRVSEPLEVSQVESGEYEGCWALANRYVPGKNLHQAFDEAEANGTFDEVFDRFTRLANAAGAPGHGLGLAHAKDIARAHNGRVSAAVENGVFTVQISL